MANERLAKGPEDGPDYTETNGASWLPGFTCGGREGKVEGEEAEAASEAEEMSSRAGFTRMLSFWKLMGPLIVRYKLVRKLPKGDVRDEELERLHDKYAPLVLQNILGLRGLYVKLGQAISIAPMAPDQYREQLAVLQNGVPPKSPAEVRRIIVEGLGKPIAKLFKWIDDEPIGSASIGQVHRAELLDGRQVVVKIQYPEVKANFASDLSQLRNAARMWSPSVMGEVQEMATHFTAELSFEREAYMMDTVAANLEAAGFARIAVPRSIPGLVSDMVLVMSYLPGTTLLEAAKAMAAAHAKLLGVSPETLGRALRAHSDAADAAHGAGREAKSSAAAAAEAGEAHLTLKHPDDDDEEDDDTRLMVGLSQSQRGSAMTGGGQVMKVVEAGKAAGKAAGQYSKAAVAVATETVQAAGKEAGRVVAAADAAAEAAAETLRLKAVEAKRLAERGGRAVKGVVQGGVAAATGAVGLGGLGGGGDGYGGVNGAGFSPLDAREEAREEARRREAEPLPSLCAVSLVHAYLRAKRCLSCGLLAGPVLFDPVEQTSQLVAAYGQKIFLDGVFGADPHPGNLLLLPDGRLGMIDFGMTKELTDTERHTLARSLVAVVEDDEPEMLKLAHEAGLRSRYMRPETLIYFVRFAWGDFTDSDEAEMVVKADPITQSSGGLTLVRRVVFMLRGLCQVLGCPVDLVKTWEPIARQVLDRPAKHTGLTRCTRCCGATGLGPNLQVHRQHESDLRGQS